MNTSYIFAGVGFIAGAVISGIATYAITKTSLDKRHQRDLDEVWNDVKEFKTHQDDIHEEISESESKPAATFVNEKPDLMAYANKIRSENYIPEPIAEEKYRKDEAPKNDIYEIDYTTFDGGEEEGYTHIDLTLYANGILADDMDIPLRDPVASVGENIVDLMEGRDEVLIRNERRMVDYDITRSERTFDQMLVEHPETSQRLLYDTAREEYYSEEG